MRDSELDRRIDQANRERFAQFAREDYAGAEVGLAVQMLIALLCGLWFPPQGVADTDRNRRLWPAIAADLVQLEMLGILPDVPGGA